jgi:hypothetical protein
MFYNTQLTMLIFTKGGKLENPEKNPLGTGENNTSNKLNSHVPSRNGTWTTAVRSEH